MGDSVGEEIGKEVDGYRILDVIGKGGMGVVYKAEDVALSRPVAIKRVIPTEERSEQLIRRFKSEAQALARIDSSYIVRIYALRETDDLGLLIIMEYVGGGTLNDVLNEEGALRWERGLPFVTQILRAFEDAHDVGVIHRDIKPHNIMLSGGEQVKITDFGIAKLRQPDSEKTITQGGMGGTLKYMSPEQVEGSTDLDYRSDLYSLGMTAYQMFSGGFPYDEDDSDFDIMRRIVEGDIGSIGEAAPDLPAGLVHIFDKALARDPNDRYQSATAMREAIEAFEEDPEAPRPGEDTASGGTVLATSQPTPPGAGDEADPDEGGTVLADEAAGAPSERDADLEGDAEPDPEPVPEGEAAGPGTPADAEAAPASASPAPGASASDGADDETEGSSRLAWLAGVVALLAVAVAVGGILGYTSSDTAMLSVSTQPNQATVFVDGEPVGTTPLTQHEVASGERTVRVEKEGYRPVDTTIAVSEGGPIDLSGLTLAAQEAQFSLTTNPDGATVFVDGRNVGETPLLSEDVSGGTHDVRIQKQGYEAKSLTLTVAPGQTKALEDIELAATQQASAGADESATGQPAAAEPSEATATAAASGSIRVEAPAAATVRVNGEARGAGRAVQLPAGTHDVQCTHPRYDAIRTTVSVEAGAERAIACYFEQRLTVTVMGARSWGNIAVNGENTGKSAPSTITLPPGTHNISLLIQRSSGPDVAGGAYRLKRDGDVATQNTFDGSTYEVRIEPGFQKEEHAIAFRVE
jgi:tRNA A-37 threonylcarbamoyl transferase component Bud32